MLGRVSLVVVSLSVCVSFFSVLMGYFIDVVLKSVHGC